MIIQFKPVKWKTNIALLEVDLHSAIINNPKQYRFPHAVFLNAHTLIAKPFSFDGMECFAIVDNKNIFWDKDNDCFVHGQPSSKFSRNQLASKLFHDLDSVQTELQRIVIKYSNPNNQWFLIDIDDFVAQNELEQFEKDRE